MHNQIDHPLQPITTIYSRESTYIFPIFWNKRIIHPSIPLIKFLSIRKGKKGNGWLGVSPRNFRHSSPPQRSLLLVSSSSRTIINVNSARFRAFLPPAFTEKAMLERRRSRSFIRYASGEGEVAVDGARDSRQALLTSVR